MTKIEKLKSLNLSEDTVVHLEYSDGTDVFVHNESEVETALEATNVVDIFSELITTPKICVEAEYSGNPLESLRDDGLLEDYNRGDYNFSEYVAEAISENFYDVDLIDYSVEKYDYKRGFCTLSASLKSTVKSLLTSQANIEQWKVSVDTDAGLLTLS